MLIGILAGAVGGYLYFHFVGCNGTCLIASSPWISTIYGAVLGGLVVNMFRSNALPEILADPRVQENWPWHGIISIFFLKFVFLIYTKGNAHAFQVQL